MSFSDRVVVITGASDGLAGVASSRSVTLPAASPVSTKPPAASDCVCAATLPPASCTATRTPAIGAPSGVTKRPRTPVTPPAASTDTRTSAVLLPTKPPDTLAAVIVTSWSAIGAAPAAALSSSVPLWPRARWVGLNAAVTPAGNPATDSCIRPL